MPFINEKIPDADKSRIDWTRFRRDRRDTTGLQLATGWTIDRDRDAFFVQLHTGNTEWGTKPVYALCLRGNIIRIVTAGPDSYSQKDTGIWEIEEIDLPPHLEAERPQIIEIIKEAINAFGWANLGEAYRPREI